MIAVDLFPQALRVDLVPTLENLVDQVRPQGLWLFGSWARGTASRHSDVDVLVMGLAAPCRSNLWWQPPSCSHAMAMRPSGDR